MLTRYVVTDKDAAGPFDKLPADLEARRQLKAMPYESLDEALPERFDVSPAYLKQINSRTRIAAGSEIVVPNVVAGKPPANATLIEIDKSSRVLYVLDAGRPGSRIVGSARFARYSLCQVEAISAVSEEALRSF